VTLIHIHLLSLRLLIGSYRNAPDWMCEYLLAVIDPSASYWITGFPSAWISHLRRGQCSSPTQGVASKRAVHRRGTVTGDDADRVRDRPERVHDHLKRGTQGAVPGQPPRCHHGARGKWRAASSAAQGVSCCDVDGLCAWDILWVTRDSEAPRLGGLGLLLTEIFLIVTAQVRCRVYVGVVGERTMQPDRMMVMPRMM